MRRYLLQNDGRLCGVNCIIVMMELLLKINDQQRLEAISKHSGDEFVATLQRRQAHVIEQFERDQVINRNEEANYKLGKRISRRTSKQARELFLRRKLSDSDKQISASSGKKNNQVTTNAEEYPKLPPPDTPITTLMHLYKEQILWEMEYKQNCRNSKCNYRKETRESLLWINNEDAEWDGKVLFPDKIIGNCPQCCATFHMLYEQKVLNPSTSGILIYHLSSESGLLRSPEISPEYNHESSFIFKGAIFCEGDHFFAVIKLDSFWIQFDDGCSKQLQKIDVSQLKWNNAYILFYKKN